MGKKGKSKGKGGSAGHVDAAPTIPATPALPPPDATQVAMRLNTAAIHLLRRLHREDATLGLSSTRMSALSVLVLGGPRTLGQLAEAEGVTPPSMTRLVTAMEQDGLVARSRTDQDGRLVMIEATAKGAELLRWGRDARVGALVDLVRTLPLEDQHCLDRAAAVLEDVLRPVRRS